MDADAATAARAAGPARLTGSLEAAGAFLRAAGLIVDEITASRVTGHLQLSQEHHTPWGIVHGVLDPSRRWIAATPVQLVIDNAVVVRRIANSPDL